MTQRELVITGLVVSAPLILALVVALLRGYTIDLHMARGPGRRRRRRAGDPDDADADDADDRD